MPRYPIYLPASTEVAAEGADRRPRTPRRQWPSFRQTVGTAAHPHGLLQ